MNDLEKTLLKFKEAVDEAEKKAGKPLNTFFIGAGGKVVANLDKKEEKNDKQS